MLATGGSTVTGECRVAGGSTVMVGVLCCWGGLLLGEGIFLSAAGGSIDAVCWGDLLLLVGFYS